jgi:hypothetical protein
MEKCQTTETIIFSSNPKAQGHSPQNFMITGHVEKLWKFNQASPIIKWQRHNLKTTHALTFKFLSELAHIKNSTLTKFHNFWSNRTQVIKLIICIYFKTHFKGPFNSSRIKITHIYFIFFLNTTLHTNPNKLGITSIESTKLRYGIYNITNKSVKSIKEKHKIKTLTDYRAGSPTRRP